MRKQKSEINASVMNLSLFHVGLYLLEVFLNSKSTSNTWHLKTMIEHFLRLQNPSIFKVIRSEQSFSSLAVLCSVGGREIQCGMAERLLWLWLPVSYRIHS